MPTYSATCWGVIQQSPSGSVGTGLGFGIGHLECSDRCASGCPPGGRMPLHTAGVLLATCMDMVFRDQATPSSPQSGPAADGAEPVRDYKAMLFARRYPVDACRTRAKHGEMRIFDKRRARPRTAHLAMALLSLSSVAAGLLTAASRSVCRARRRLYPRFT